MLRRLVRRYQVMNRDEYRDNSKLAVLARQVQRLEMPDLLAPDGKPLKKEEKVLLHAVPENPVVTESYEDDPFYSTLLEYKPELIYLQANPMNYIARQRYLSFQLAMKGEEEYEKKATYSIDYPIPLNWEECVVNLLTLDMLRNNCTMSELELSKGLACYSYPHIQAYEDQTALTETFIQTITSEIIGNTPSKYHYLNQILYLGLMGKSKVLLGDMPEELLRMQLGNTIPLETVREMYGFVVEKLKEHYMQHPDVPISMEEITLMCFPHIFQMPRDLYLTALLKEAFPAVNLTAAFVGAPHFLPIQRYWVGPPAGINYTQATYIPPRIPNETDEMLVEKQVLFDLMLDSKVWGQKYLTNPFPYIVESIEDLTEKDRGYFKQYFSKMISNYSQLRDKQLESVKRIT